VKQLDFLATLEAVIQDRLSNPKAGSYTAELAAGGRLKVAQKFGEEAVETVVAAVAEDDVRLTAEAADLIYHFLVLLNLRGLGLADVAAELERRYRKGRGPDILVR
jgi:phosphoribosyl-ATP pyrophosphohydrolase